VISSGIHGLLRIVGCEDHRGSSCEGSSPPPDRKSWSGASPSAIVCVPRPFGHVSERAFLTSSCQPSPNPTVLPPVVGVSPNRTAPPCPPPPCFHDRLVRRIPPCKLPNQSTRPGRSISSPPAWGPARVPNTHAPRQAKGRSELCSYVTASHALVSPISSGRTIDSSDHSAAPHLLRATPNRLHNRFPNDSAARSYDHPDVRSSAIASTGVYAVRDQTPKAHDMGKFQIGR